MPCLPDHPKLIVLLKEAEKIALNNLGVDDLEYGKI
jgi:hypothetical protein